MTTTRDALVLTVYAPALVRDDGRTLAIVHGVERALPHLHLDWEVSEEGKPIALPQRDAWLAEAAAHGDFPLVCNGDESYPVMFHGLETLASSAPGGQPLFDVHGELPLDAPVIAAAAALLEGMAEGAHAMWGYATPGSTVVDIAEQTTRSPTPPRGLPRLKPFRELRAPEIPPRLGWMNYWSAAAARAIGFPDPARDADLLARARRTASGGWIVPLTETPLDLDNPAHLDALLRAYERFPEIGGRANP